MMNTARRNNLFPRVGLEPMTLQVDAKRELCAVYAGYLADLSPTSKRSMELQGWRYGAINALAWVTSGPGSKAST